MSASALQIYFADVLQLQQQQQHNHQLVESRCYLIVPDQHRSHARHQKGRRGDLPNCGGLVRQHSEQRWKVCEDSSNNLQGSPSMEMIRKTAASRRRRPVSSSSTTVVPSKPIAVRWFPNDITPITNTRSGRGRTATTATRRSDVVDLLQGESGLRMPQRCESPPPTYRSRSPSISPSELHQFRRCNSFSPLAQQKTDGMCQTTSLSSSPETSSSLWLSLSPDCSLLSSPSSSSSSRSAIPRMESFLKNEDEEKLRYQQALNVASAHCSCASPLRKTGTSRHVFPHAA